MLEELLFTDMTFYTMPDKLFHIIEWFPKLCTYVSCHLHSCSFDQTNLKRLRSIESNSRIWVVSLLTVMVIAAVLGINRIFNF